ncbi:MAG: 4Fe-4S binding protein [Atopobium sp.]|uniref:4Fe-4S binding protein n=1 Tax=Atopobium sp. TaxID=1872650 RepID=UPI002A83688C|nr:4Fe-4S binding protein [Atopobium sp.]MDY4523342.1 4Fe-4S binding protein [Atopobium sp.]
MADENHDLLDSLIDIQSDWNAVSNPLDTVLEMFAADPEQAKPFNPGDYKFRPRANTIPCTRCMTQDEGTCSACIDVCPVDAITIDKSAIRVSDACRKCGLCIAACPTDAFTDSHHSARQLYDDIATACSSHEMCYVTCTRALKRKPEENEILLPCVGAVPTEVWFSILVEYPNVSVYLPEGICDKCQTTTGEACYVSFIGRAEELTGRSVGLETQPNALNHAKKRSYERRQFVNNAMQVGQNVLAISNPVLASAQAVQRKLQAHGRKINELQNSLERIAGSSTSARRKRTIVQKRQLVLSALQDHPRLADRFEPQVAVCDSTKCTSCGLCVDVCPTHCVDLDTRGHVTVEPIYCMDCSACIRTCPTNALFMEPVDPSLLVVKDEAAARAEEALERQKAEVARLKEQGKQQLMRGLAALESYGEDGQITAQGIGAAIKAVTTFDSPTEKSGEVPTDADAGTLTDADAGADVGALAKGVPEAPDAAASTPADEPIMPPVFVATQRTTQVLASASDTIACQQGATDEEQPRVCKIVPSGRVSLQAIQVVTSAK